MRVHATRYMERDRDRSMWNLGSGPTLSLEHQQRSNNGDKASIESESADSGPSVSEFFTAQTAQSRTTFYTAELPWEDASVPSAAPALPLQ